MKMYHLKLLAPLLCFTTRAFNTALRNKIILRQNMKERSDGEIDKGVVPIPGDSTF